MISTTCDAMNRPLTHTDGEGSVTTTTHDARRTTHDALGRTHTVNDHLSNTFSRVRFDKLA